MRPDRDRPRVEEAECEEDEPELGVDRRVEEIALEDVREDDTPGDTLVFDTGPASAPACDGGNDEETDF